MSKPMHASDDEIKHWVLPEVRGNIVGESSDPIPPQTVEDIEALHKQAYEEGFQQGKREGMEQGREEGFVQMQEQAQRLANMFHYFEQPLQELDRDMEQQLTDLALQLARLVIKKAVVADEEHILNLVHEALAFLPANSRNINVRLNSSDRQLLEQAGIDTEAQDWGCISDDSITQGGCVIESESSHIDASLEKRMDEIFEQIKPSSQGVADGSTD